MRILHFPKCRICNLAMKLCNSCDRMIYFCLLARHHLKIDVPNIGHCSEFNEEGEECSFGCLLFLSIK